MLVPADESSGQTVNVHQSRIERSCGFAPAAVSGTTLDDWRNFQEWIGAAAPYEVVIPFYNALQAAYNAHEFAATRAPRHRWHSDGRSKPPRWRTGCSAMSIRAAASLQLSTTIGGRMSALLRA